MGFLDSLAGYAPYVAPIIERHRQRDLQTMMLKQQQDEQDKKDKLAAAIGQSTIGRNASSAAAADALAKQRGIPKVPGVKYVTDENGNLIQVPTTATPSAASPAASAPSDEPQSDMAGPQGGQEPKPQVPGVQTTTSASPRIGVNTGIKMAPKPDATKVFATNRQFAIDHPLSTKIDPLGAQGVAARKDLQANAAKLRPPPAPAVQFLTSQDSTGKPIYAVGDKRTRQITPTTAPGAPQVASGMARGFGQGGVFGAGSGIGSVNEMQAVNPNMKEFENRVAQGTANMGGWDSFREGLISHAKSNNGFIDKGKTTVLLDNLMRTNPDLAEYATNKLAWVMSDLNLSRGSSDERGRIATVADGLDLPIGAMNPASRARYVQQMQQRRDTRLEGLKQSAGAAKSMLNSIDKSLSSGRGGQAKVPSVGAGPTGGPPGDINLGAPAAGQKATPQQLERAKTDPLYAQFLRDTGKMP